MKKWKLNWMEWRLCLRNETKQMTTKNYIWKKTLLMFAIIIIIISIYIIAKHNNRPNNVIITSSSLLSCEFCFCFFSMIQGIIQHICIVTIDQNHSFIESQTRITNRIWSKTATIQFDHFIEWNFFFATELYIDPRIQMWPRIVEFSKNSFFYGRKKTSHLTKRPRQHY